MVVVVGELDGASVGGVVLGRGSGFGVGEVGLPGGNGELGAAEEERRRAKLGDAVVWRGADAGRVSVNADCSTAKQAHCTRFANRDSFFCWQCVCGWQCTCAPHHGCRGRRIPYAVAGGAFLPQSRVAQVRLPQSRVKHRGAGPFTAREVVRTKKDNTCNNTTRT